MSENKTERVWRRRAGSWTEDEAEAVVSEFRASGKSPQEFAESRGFSVSRLLKWNRRIANGKQPGAAMQFLPVRISASREEECSKVSSANAIEVVLRGGEIVRVGLGFDVTHLRKVISALEGKVC